MNHSITFLIDALIFSDCHLFNNPPHHPPGSSSRFPIHHVFVYSFNKVFSWLSLLSLLLVSSFVCLSFILLSIGPFFILPFHIHEPILLLLSEGKKKVEDDLFSSSSSLPPSLSLSPTSNYFLFILINFSIVYLRPLFPLTLSSSPHYLLHFYIPFLSSFTFSSSHLYHYLLFPLLSSFFFAPFLSSFPLSSFHL